MSSDRYLEIVRRLALLAPVFVGCSGAPAPAAPVPEPVAKPSPPSPRSTSVSNSSTSEDLASPCRCAWASDIAAAKRICADAAIDHAGNACVRGADHSPSNEKHIPMGGPLAPPELASWSGVA